MARLGRLLDGAAWLDGLASRHGVIKGSELGLARAAESRLREAGREAEALREAARQEAQDLQAAARREAQALLDKADRAVKRLRTQAVKDAETKVWNRFAEHQRRLDEQHAAFRAALEAQALPVLAKAVAMLADEVSPEARLQATLKALFDQAGMPPGAVLMVAEQDLDRAQRLPAVPWPLRPDAALRAGVCRLAADGGDWESSFEGRLQLVLAAFEQVASNDEGEKDGRH